MCLLIHAWLLACVAQTGDTDEIRRLIDRLSDTSIEVRQEAVQRLTALGSVAAPALETAARDSDIQRASCAREILTELARRRRIEDLRPTVRRVTLTLKDTPFPEAASRLADAFGLVPPVYDPEVRDRRVSLDLRESTLWEGLDALEKAGGARLDELDPCRSHRSEFDNQLLFENDRHHPRLPHQDMDDARLCVTTGRTHWQGKGPVASSISFTLLLPPQAWADEAEFENVRLTEDGKDVPFEKNMQNASCRRIRGLPTRIVIGSLEVTRKNREKARDLQVAGDIVVQVPESIRIVQPTGGERLLLVFPFGELKGTWYGEKKSFNAFLKASSGADPLRFQIAAYDTEDRWLGDIHFRIEENVFFTGGETEILSSEPKRLEMWQVTRRVRRVLPFRFARVQLPALSDQ